MEQVYPLADGRGTLTLREEGPRAVLEVHLPDDGRGLYKAYLTGGGAQYLLGTLMPERGALRLKRTVTLDELKRRRMWPPQGGAVELSFSFQKKDAQAKPAAPPSAPPGWHWELQPARLLGDRLLVQAAGDLHKALVRRNEDGFRLAIPYREGHVFPLTPLFCFAAVELLEENYYIIFTFNHRGCPIFPNSP